MSLLPALLLSSAFAVDTGPYQAVLDAHVRGGKVDYAGVKADGALDAWTAGLANATEPSGKADKMAFWINAYNALTVELIADEWPLSSIMDLDGGKVWDTRTFSVAGRQVTLNHIEHKILRPLGDPRIHAAVNCASIGCPPLQSTAFSGSALESQLAAASRGWAQTNGARIDKAQGIVQLNQIFDWYGGDFAGTAGPDIPGVNGKQEDAINFLADHSDADTAAWLRAGGYTVSWSAYDWRVNKQ